MIGDRVTSIAYYKETPALKTQIVKSYNHSVGGIKIKLEKKIAYYKYMVNKDMMDSYKQGALEDLHKELFG